MVGGCIDSVPPLHPVRNVRLRDIFPDRGLSEDAPFRFLSAPVLAERFEDPNRISELKIEINCQDESRKAIVDQI